jgi:hypothetical protein
MYVYIRWLGFTLLLMTPARFLIARSKELVEVVKLE